MSNRAPNSEDDLIGQVLHDTYRIIRKIEEGGMGAVYEAVHVRLPSKRYAVKLLLPGSQKVPYAFKRFQREALIASELGHPNIVDVVDFYKTNWNQPYMVMEYLEGASLAKVFEQAGPLSLQALLAFVTQVGSGLSAAHACGIVHRDLKPDNIIVNGFGTDEVTAKILDFGISKIRHSKSVVTQDHAVMGTAYYMSPEQAEGQVSDIDQTTDIFALGTICYEGLTGCLPFDAPTLPGVIYKICHSTPTPPSSIHVALPAGVDVVLARAMAKSKTERYQQVDAFVDDLVRQLEVSGSDSGQRKVNVPGVGTTPGIGTPAESPLSDTERAETLRPHEAQVVETPSEAAGRVHSLPTQLLASEEDETVPIQLSGRDLETVGEEGKDTDPYTGPGYSALGPGTATVERDKRLTTLSRSAGERGVDPREGSASRKWWVTAGIAGAILISLVGFLVWWLSGPLETGPSSAAALKPIDAGPGSEPLGDIGVDHAVLDHGVDSTRLTPDLRLHPDRKKRRAPRRPRRRKRKPDGIIVF